MRSRPALLPAALLSAALLLGGCSSGAADAPSSTATTSTVGTSSATTPGTSGPGTAASSSVASAQADSTASTASSRLVTGTTSAPLSSRSPRPTPTAPSPSGTAAVGTFTPNTVRFFAALCGGLANRPADQLDRLTGSTAEQRAAASRLFQQQAEALNGAVRGMQSAGAPDIPDGDVLYKAVLSTYPQMAAAARKGSVLIAQTTGQADLAQAIEQARQTTTDAAAPLAAVDDVVGAPAVVSRLRAIPACVSVLRN